MKNKLLLSNLLLCIVTTSVYADDLGLQITLFNTDNSTQISQPAPCEGWKIQVFQPDLVSVLPTSPSPKACSSSFEVKSPSASVWFSTENGGNVGCSGSCKAPAWQTNRKWSIDLINNKN